MCPKCGKIINVDLRYCCECEVKVNSNRNNLYDRTIRYNEKNIQYTNFYKSIEWLTLRDYVLKHYKKMDLYEYYINYNLIDAETVHHIIEIKEDWSQRLSFNNMFPCSSGNHNVIHSLYDKDRVSAQVLLHSLKEKFEREFGVG